MIDYDPHATGLLGALFKPLDYPRRALWKGIQGVGEGNLKAILPALAAIPGGLVGGPWGAALTSGAAYGLGQELDPTTFDNPGEDVSPLLKILGDPLTYLTAGGVGKLTQKALGRGTAVQGTGRLSATVPRDLGIGIQTALTELPPPRSPGALAGTLAQAAQGGLELGSLPGPSGQVLLTRQPGARLRIVVTRNPERAAALEEAGAQALSGPNARGIEASLRDLATEARAGPITPASLNLEQVLGRVGARLRPEAQLETLHFKAPGVNIEPAGTLRGGVEARARIGEIAERVREEQSLERALAERAEGASAYGKARAELLGPELSFEEAVKPRPPVKPEPRTATLRERLLKILSPEEAVLPKPVKAKVKPERLAEAPPESKTPKTKEKKIGVRTKKAAEGTEQLVFQQALDRLTEPDSSQDMVNAVKDLLKHTTVSAPERKKVLAAADQGVKKLRYTKAAEEMVLDQIAGLLR